MATNGILASSSYYGRSLTLSWELTNQSTEANASTINWRLTSSGTAAMYQANNFSVIINDTNVYSNNDNVNLYDGTLIASGNVSIEHDADGTKDFNVIINGDINGNTVSGSDTFDLPTISLITTISTVSGSATSDNLTVICEKNSTNFTDKLVIQLNSQTIMEISDYESGDDVYLSQSAMEEIYEATPSAQVVTLDFFIETYNDTALLSESNHISKLLTVASTAPTIESCVYSDANPSTVLITQDNQYIIRNQSILSVDVTALASYDNAALSSLRVEGGGITYAESISGISIASRSVMLGVVDQSGGFELKVTLTDSRGKSCVKTLTILVYDWQTPTAVVSAEREGNYYPDTDIKVDAIYKTLGGHNTLSIVGKYKKTTDTTWSADVNLANGHTTTITLDNNYAWDLRIVVSDRISYSTYNLVINRGLPTFFIDKLNHSIGINCIPASEDSLEVNGVDVVKSIFFENAETLTINGMVLNGVVSTSATRLQFTIPLPKASDWLTASFNHLAIEIIGNGQNEQITEIVGDSTYSVTNAYATDNSLVVTIDKSTRYSFSTNTIVGVIVDCTIAFTA